MNRNRCCFSGHSKIYDEESIFYAVKNKIEDLIVNKSVSEFWVGNYGQFDSISAKAVRELKIAHTDIELNLVIPYLTKGINEYKQQYYKKFDNILMADVPENTPKRFQILKCNQYMIDNSKYLICCIDHSWGGAAKTFEYATSKKNIKIFNLSK